MIKRSLATLLVAVAVLGLAATALAQSAVGDTAPAAGTTAVIDADNILTAAGTIRFMGGGGAVGAIDVMCNGDATFYLYDINGSGVITRRWGPFYCRSWMMGRSPVPPGSRADMLHLISLGGTEFIVTPRGQ